MSASVRYLEEKTAVPSLKQTQQTVSYLTAENTRKTEVQDGILGFTSTCYLQGNQINKGNSDISNPTTKSIRLGLY